MTQVLNNSVSLNNLDISSRNFNSSPIHNGKSKEFSTPVKSASESAVLQNTNKKLYKSSSPSGVELIIENSNPDPVRNKLKI